MVQSMMEPPPPLKRTRAGVTRAPMLVLKDDTVFIFFETEEGGLSIIKSVNFLWINRPYSLSDTPTEWLEEILANTNPLSPHIKDKVRNEFLSRVTHIAHFRPLMIAVDEDRGFAWLVRANMTYARIGKDCSALEAIHTLEKSLDDVGMTLVSPYTSFQTERGQAILLELFDCVDYDRAWAYLLQNALNRLESAIFHFDTCVGTVQP